MKIRQSFENIKKALRAAQCSAKINRVSKETGLSKVTLYSWLDNEGASPNLDKLETLESWLIENDYLDMNLPASPPSVEPASVSASF